MPGVDIRESRLGEIYKLVGSYSKTYSRLIKDQLDTDLDDFVQTVITNIFRRKGLDNYDESKLHKGGTFESLIFRMCKNEVIDMLRKKGGTKTRTTVDGKPFQFLSFQEEIGSNDEGEGFTLLDVIAAEEGTEMVKLEMLESIPETQISPNYRLSWRQLFTFSNEMSSEQIAERIGISNSRISQLQQEMYRRFIATRHDEPKKKQEPEKPKTYADELIERVYAARASKQSSAVSDFTGTVF